MRGRMEPSSSLKDKKKSSLNASAKPFTLLPPPLPPPFPPPLTPSSSSFSPSSRHIRSLQQTALLAVDVPLSRPYGSLVELLMDEANGLHPTCAFTIQHGLLPPLHVRYLREREAQSDTDVRPHVDWLVDDLDSVRACVGVDAETGRHSTRLLQISTRTRCLLVRIPLQSHAHLYSTQNTSYQKTHVRVASSLARLLESRIVFKSGAELWGDALDIFRDLAICMNNGLNMSVVHRRGKFSLSLEGMTNAVCARCSDVFIEDKNTLRYPDAFIKDKDTTMSDWDRTHLSFRQLVYAALDAQTSYIVANMDNSRAQRPLPFHCSDLPSSWLAFASSWLSIKRYVETQLDSLKAEAVIDWQDEGAPAVSILEDASGLIVRLQKKCSSLLDEPFLYVKFTDGTDELCRVHAHTHCELTLHYVRQTILYRPRQDRDVKYLHSCRKRDLEIFMFPLHDYLTRSFHNKEPFNPFIASILDQSFAPKSTNHTYVNSHSSTIPSSTQPWWRNEEKVSASVDSNMTTINSTLAPFLSDEQQAALQAAKGHAIVAVTAAGGSGKSTTLIGEMLLSCDYRSILDPDNQSRVLVLCDSAFSARQLAQQAIKYVSPTEIGLSLPADFLARWAEQVDELSEYKSLIEQSVVLDKEEIWARSLLPLSACCVHYQYQSGSKEPNRANPRVLITTTPQVFTPSSLHPYLVHSRPTLLINEANQVFVLETLLLLRMLNSTERLIAFGDSQGLTPFLCEGVEHPLSLLTQLTLVAHTQPHSHLSHTHVHRPALFTVQHIHLHSQFSMPPHLTSLVSQLFYSSTQQLVSVDQNSNERAVWWQDVKGNSMQDNPDGASSSYSGVYNAAESDECRRVWCLLLTEGFGSGDIVVLTYMKEQRDFLLQTGGKELNMNVFVIEECALKAIKCVILTVACEFHVPKILDRYRTNSAAQRATHRLYIVGNRSNLVRTDPMWKQISDYEAQEPQPRKKQVVPDLAADFPSLHTHGSHADVITSLPQVSSTPRKAGPSAHSLSPSITVPTRVVSQASPVSAHLSGETTISNSWSRVLIPDEKLRSVVPASRTSSSARFGSVTTLKSASTTNDVVSSLSVSKIDDVDKPFRYRTTMCHFWKQKGSCALGQQCKFAHGSGELRSVEAAEIALHNYNVARQHATIERNAAVAPHVPRHSLAKALSHISILPSRTLR